MRNFNEYSDMEVSILVEEMQAGKVDYSLDDLKDCQAEIVNRRLNSRYAGIVSDLMKDKLINKADNDIIDEEPAFVPPTPEQIAEFIGESESALYATPPVVPAIASNAETRGISDFPIQQNEANDSYEFFNEKATIERTPSPADDLYDKMQDLYYAETPKGSSMNSINTDYPMFSFLSSALSIIPWIAMACIYSVFGYLALYGQFKGDFGFLIYGGIGSVVASFVILLACLGLKENLIWKMKVAKRLEIK